MLCEIFLFCLSKYLFPVIMKSLKKFHCTRTTTIHGPDAARDVENRSKRNKEKEKVQKRRKKLNFYLQTIIRASQRCVVAEQDKCLRFTIHGRLRNQRRENKKRMDLVVVVVVGAAWMKWQQMQWKYELKLTFHIAMARILLFTFYVNIPGRREGDGVFFTFLNYF